MSDFSTIAGLSAAYDAHAASPVEVTQGLLDMAQRANPVLHAFLRLAPERAMAQARLAEQRLMAGMRLGPLDGVPIAHKDNLDTADIETTANSTRYRGRVPARDAAVVAALTRAGAVTLGKAACYEGAFAGPDPDLPWPPPRNPWDLDRSTAGSSSGSAVAIAAGLVLGATGSDTGGSLRDPAALCGVTGLKPRYGSVPAAGMFPFAPSLDTAGPMARTARDAAIMLQAMQPGAVDYSGWIDRPARGLRIGVVPRWCEEAGIADDVGAVLAEATTALRSAGATITAVELPALAAFQACGWTIAMAELLASHSRAVAEDDGSGLGAMLRRGLVAADTIPAHRYIAALRRRDELARAIISACADVDVLLLPAQDGEADLVVKIAGSLPFEKGTLTLPFCVTGAAAIVIPGGLSKNGLPIGVQLAACNGEAAMLRAACALERDLGGHRHRPPMPVTA